MPLDVFLMNMCVVVIALLIRREIEYIKGVYKRIIQAEIESYKDLEDEDKRDTIQAQDVLMLDRISI